MFLLFVYATRNTEDLKTLYIYSLKPIFSKPMFKTLPCIYLTIESQIDFTFYTDVPLNLPKQLQYLVDGTLSCLEIIYLEVVVQSSPMKKVFLKTLQNMLESPF